MPPIAATRPPPRAYGIRVGGVAVIGAAVGGMLPVGARGDLAISADHDREHAQPRGD